MKVSYPNHSESMLAHLAKAVRWFVDMAVGIAGWTMVVLVGAAATLLIASLVWWALIFALQAIGGL